MHLLSFLKMVTQCPVLSSADAIQHFAVLQWAERHECLAALALCRKNNPLRSEVLSTGNCSTLAAPIRRLAYFALDAEASGLIIAHNHNSGDLTPSADDIATTRHIALWLRPLGIDLLDHIILGNAGYVSLRDRGVI